MGSGASSYDSDPKTVFGPARRCQNLSAAEFLSRTRKEIRRRVAEWTGEYQYTIDQVLESMIERCHASKLHLTQPREQAKLDFAIPADGADHELSAQRRHKVAL